jgi:inosine-uridine nucleoside N-ribohydrolase
VRLWIDTDIGHNPDDALALLCAVAHPSVELIGISTVGTDAADVTARAETARRLLENVGAPVPLLYAGPPDPRALAVADALLAIGPLTNVARVLRAGADVPPVAVMGGVLRPPVLHRGQRVDVDSNFARDPAAAATVVLGASDVLLVPLDVTAALTLGDGETEAVRAAVPMLADEIDAWHVRADAPLCLHDPATLLALCGELPAIAPRVLTIDAQGGVHEDADGGHEVDVVTHADRDVIVTRVLQLLVDASAPDEPAPTQDDCPR